ncbi:hypothetical protein DFH07DRAFT_773454 [Mycena maculata]|uniref:Uncharacterized protein n=1 Tax=Mycena maculata TaxID=230809 RepID=A0AAD7J1X6_9AGAR|nr:hypothetical protein DFH07DRAFT_773454 [Mycena maculata]
MIHLAVFRANSVRIGIGPYKGYATCLGYFVPYIADAMLNANDTQYFNVDGVFMVDPIIGDFDTQQQVPHRTKTREFPYLFSFNDTFEAELAALDETCGFTAFLNEYLVFPPKGVQPPAPSSEGGCDIFGTLRTCTQADDPKHDLERRARVPERACGSVFRTLRSGGDGGRLERKSVAIRGHGLMGTLHAERRLTLVLPGCQGPQFQPAAAFRQLEWMLGHVESMSGMEDWTTSDPVLTFVEVALPGHQRPCGGQLECARPVTDLSLKWENVVYRQAYS